MIPAMLAHDLREAAHIMRLGGLCQGTYSKGDKHCLLGALLEAHRLDIQEEFDALGKIRPLVMAVAGQLGYRGNILVSDTEEEDAFTVVTKWSDAAGRTAEQVAELLEETALAVEQRAGLISTN